MTQTWRKLNRKHVRCSFSFGDHVHDTQPDTKCRARTCVYCSVWLTLHLRPKHNTIDAVNTSLLLWILDYTCIIAWSRVRLSSCTRVELSTQTNTSARHTHAHTRGTAAGFGSLGDAHTTRPNDIQPRRSAHTHIQTTRTTISLPVTASTHAPLINAYSRVYAYRFSTKDNPIVDESAPSWRKIYSI